MARGRCRGRWRRGDGLDRDAGFALAGARTCRADGGGGRVRVRGSRQRGAYRQRAGAMVAAADACPAPARAAAHPAARLLPAVGARAGRGCRRAPGGDARGGRREVKWATRRHCHIDRAACAWLIRRFLDAEAEFVFVDDPDEVPADATAFDMRGVELSHHGGECSFEAFLHRYELDDPVMWAIARIVHEADLDDGRYDAPEALGLDVLLRGLSMVRGDDEVLELSAPLYDGLYEYLKRATLLGREPA